MQDILKGLSEINLLKAAIKANWKNYHYCLWQSPNVELSINPYLTWLLTGIPDHFMNLVVCTKLPKDGVEDLIENAMAHFREINVTRLSWLIEEGVPANEVKKHLLAYGLTLRESFATEMAADLTSLPENMPLPDGLSILRVDDHETLKKWIHVASINFGVTESLEDIWCDFFEKAVFDLPFQTYLALLNGKPVATAQLFLSAGVAGVYNVTCIPQARGRGIGAAITMASLLDAQKMGYQVGILQASQSGYKVYRQLGFQDYGKLSVFLWKHK
ncbi:MAG: GNAT family N-acetyltransferase [Chloroflexota bacterium]